MMRKLWILAILIALVAALSVVTPQMSGGCVPEPLGDPPCSG